MSKDEDKVKRSKRLHADETHIKKQVSIAKQHGLGHHNTVVKEPHRLDKHHAMDCGNPGCYMCGNPRRTHKDKLTAQEKKLFQDLEKHRNRHNNGLKNSDE